MTSNPFKNVRIEYHILQSFPVTCLNRDDVNAPKTALIGGKTRARVSSQCWKRQIRITLQELGITLGTRTKKIEELMISALQEKNATPEQAQACAKLVCEALSKDTLLFITKSEQNALVKVFEEYQFNVEPEKTNSATEVPDSEEINEKNTKGKKSKENTSTKEIIKKLQKACKAHFTPALDGLDVALFGRMVAQASELQVEAAASFSHAISTHEISNEIDFFTALDDLKKADETGSAHMGSLEYNSATYYRYICLDLGQLYTHIGAENLSSAIEAFTKALYIAVPSARQTSLAGACPWEYARVLIRKGQGIQASFETAVKAKNGGYLESSKEALSQFLTKHETQAGSLYGKIADYTLGEGDTQSIDNIIEKLQTEVKNIHE